MATRQVSAAGTCEVPALVPHEVSAAKLQRQLDQWRQNEDLYRGRGWLLLGVDDLKVEVGFLTPVPTHAGALPVMTACVQLRYDNFDLWAPSLTFLDPFTRQPTMPQVLAPERVGMEVRNALVVGHPATGLPFLCLPGIREYHQHPQHDGDDWLIHRTQGAGNLAVICERVWRRMSRNVLALQVTTTVLPLAGPQVEISLVQGDPDELAAQVAAAQAQALTPGQPTAPAAAEPLGAVPASAVPEAPVMP